MEVLVKQRIELEQKGVLYPRYDGHLFTKEIEMSWPPSKGVDIRINLMAGPRPIQEVYYDEGLGQYIATLKTISRLKKNWLTLLEIDTESEYVKLVERFTNSDWTDSKSWNEIKR